jgi:hypothetical protein
VVVKASVPVSMFTGLASGEDSAAETPTPPAQDPSK